MSWRFAERTLRLRCNRGVPESLEELSGIHNEFVPVTSHRSIREQAPVAAGYKPGGLACQRIRSGQLADNRSSLGRSEAPGGRPAPCRA